MINISELEFLIGVLSFSLVLSWLMYHLLKWHFKRRDTKFAKRVAESRRLLLIESKLKKLGRRIAIPDWESLDD